MPGQSYIVLRTRSGKPHSEHRQRKPILRIHSLIMFSQHSKSIFMNLKPIISFVEQTQRKASQFISGSEVDQSPSYIIIGTD